MRFAQADSSVDRTTESMIWFSAGTSCMEELLPDFRVDRNGEEWNEILITALELNVRLKDGRGP